MKIWYCSVCGYAWYGPDAPAECPQCKAAKDKFVEISPEVDDIVKPFTDANGPLARGVRKMLLKILHPVPAVPPE